MQYIFRPDPKGSHLRTADSVRGNLIEVPDAATIIPASVKVDAASFTVWVEAVPPVPLVKVRPAPARTLSKLTLTRRLRDLGKEDAFWTILTAQPVLYREFILAQELRTDDPMFTSQAPQLKAALGLTDGQFNALIAP